MKLGAGYSPAPFICYQRTPYRMPPVPWRERDSSNNHRHPNRHSNVDPNPNGGPKRQRIIRDDANPNPEHPNLERPNRDPNLRSGSTPTWTPAGGTPTWGTPTWGTPIWGTPTGTRTSTDNYDGLRRCRHRKREDSSPEQGWKVSGHIHDIKLQLTLDALTRCNALKRRNIFLFR